MRRHLPTLASCLVLPLLLAASTCVHAEIYMCKDASGRTITSDRPIPECANRAMRQLDANGLTRREIAAPLTPEQKRARDVVEEKRRVDKAAADEQRLYDNALTTRYRNEDDVALARKRAIDLLNDQMKIDTAALARENKEMKAAQAVVAGAKAAVPAVDRRHLEETARAVESRLESVSQRLAEIDRTHRKFDLALKRFREISAAK
ncbi:MAG: DUF4124 domain-containing protein [Herminiimonas sp.]|nr:DUF4124 domain-containing protein [Herminiimonas sp.]